MALNLGGLQRAAVAEIKMLLARVEQPLQRQGNRVGIILKGRAFSPAGSDDSADPNPRGEQIANQGRLQGMCKVVRDLTPAPSD